MADEGKILIGGVPPELADYVEQHILPRYASFDAAHGPEHARKVIANAFELAAEHGARPNMVYVAAAYHDLGLASGRDGHERASGAILEADEALRTWFTGEEIGIMRQAVEDHRASRGEAPRGLYGRILAEADRDIEYETILRRTIQYSLSEYPDYTYEQHFARTRDHIENKYGEQGYLKLWLDTARNREGLRRLREALRGGGLEEDFARVFREEAV